MMTNSFENKKFHAVNEKALNGFSFFFCLAEGRGGVIFVFFPCSPMCSHPVPMRFPKFWSCSQDFPNSTSALSHMVCPKSNSHVYNFLAIISLKILRVTLDKGSRSRHQWIQAILLVESFKLVPRPLDEGLRSRHQWIQAISLVLKALNWSQGL